MTSSAYYQSFVETTNRVRRDRIKERTGRVRFTKAKCKKGKPCGDICISQKAKCNEGNALQPKSQANSVAANAIRGAVAVAGLALGAKMIQDIQKEAEDIKQAKEKVAAAGKYNENLNNWNKKYAGKQYTEFTTEEWKQAHDEFQKNREEFKRKAGFDPDPGFDDQWKQSVGSGKHKPDPVKNEQGKAYYDVLGVPKDATPQQIKAAYRKLAAQLHPDNRETGNPDKFREATEAYEKAQAHKGSARGKGNHKDSVWDDIESAYHEAIAQHPTMPNSYWYNFSTYDPYSAWRKPLDLL